MESPVCFFPLVFVNVIPVILNIACAYLPRDAHFEVLSLARLTATIGSLLFESILKGIMYKVPDLLSRTVNMKAGKQKNRQINHKQTS
jgi:hypothetical protein